MNNALTTLAIYALPIFLTLTLPIALQAWAANRLGDPTPRMNGRLSWDPVRHMDWLGTVALPALFMVMQSGFLLGWAKPLELDARRYRSRMALFLVEAPLFAGPLLMAVLWVFAEAALNVMGIQEVFVSKVASAGVSVGVSFFAIAMLPFPPMPLGNAILRNLPARYLMKVLPLLQYSSFIILGLLVLGVLSPYINAMRTLGLVLVQFFTLGLL